MLLKRRIVPLSSFEKKSPYLKKKSLQFENVSILKKVRTLDNSSFCEKRAILVKYIQKDIESVDHFGFFRGLKWSLFGNLRLLKNKWTFLELSGPSKSLIWARLGAWNPAFLEISGSWNISALLELSGSWNHPEMAF